MAPTDLTDLSLVVPVYNEEQRLPEFLDALGSAAPAAARAAGFELIETIIVDDGSTDNTRGLLEEAERTTPGLRVIRFPHNRGRGAALKTAMLAARAPFALQTDVDLSTPLEEVARLAGPVRDGADIAIGSRALPDSDITIRQSRLRETMGRTFNRIVRRLTGLPFHDTQCGFKLFDLETTRPVFEAQTIEGFASEVEVLMLARARGLRIEEVAVQWAHREPSTVRLFGSSREMFFDIIRVARHMRKTQAGGRAHNPK